MVEDFPKYMHLARVLNTSWGTGSQVKTSPSQSVKFSLTDEKLLKVSFQEIVLVPNTNNLKMSMAKRFKLQALEKLKPIFAKLTQDYKDLTGDILTLKLKEETVQSGFEFLTNAQYRPTLSAYFRLDCLVDIG